MEMSYKVILDSRIERIMLQAEMKYFRATVLYETFKLIKSRKMDNFFVRRVLSKVSAMKGETLDMIMETLPDSMVVESMEKGNEVIIKIVFPDLFFSLPNNALPFQIPMLKSVMKKWNPDSFSRTILKDTKDLYGNAELLYMKESDMFQDSKGDTHRIN